MCSAELNVPQNHVYLFKPQTVEVKETTGQRSGMVLANVI